MSKNAESRRDKEYFHENANNSIHWRSLMEYDREEKLIAIFDGEKEITEEMYQEIQSFIDHIESK